MTDETIPRRKFLVGAGLAGTRSPTGLTQPARPRRKRRPPPATGTAPAPQAEPLLILNETEHAFIVAAVDTLIPADELSPSGSDCGLRGLYRPPARQRLGRRRQDVSRRAVFQRQAGAGLPARR